MDTPANRWNSQRSRRRSPEPISHTVQLYGHADRNDEIEKSWLPHPSGAPSTKLADNSYSDLHTGSSSSSHEHAPRRTRRVGPSQDHQKSGAECRANLSPCIAKFLVHKSYLPAGDDSLIECLRGHASTNILLSDTLDDRTLVVVTSVAKEDVMQIGSRLVWRLARPSDKHPVSDPNVKLSMLVPSAVVDESLGQSLKESCLNTAASLRIHEPVIASEDCEPTQEVSIFGSHDGVVEVVYEVIQRLHSVRNASWFLAWVEISDNPETKTRELPCRIARFRIPTTVVGVLIGIKGAIVKSMEEECQAKLGFREDPFSSNFRILDVLADTDNSLEKAIMRIVGKVAEAFPDGFELLTLVPRAVVGAILGHGGSVVHKLREESGAQVRVNEPNVKSKDAETTYEVSVCGSPRAVEKASVAICRTSQTFRRESWFMAWAWTGISRKVLSGRNTVNGQKNVVEDESNSSVIEDVFALKLLLPQATVRRLLRNDGSMIANLGHDCEARLKVSGPSEVYPKTSCRVLSVGARTQDSVVSVCRKVLDLVAEDETSVVQGDHDCLRISALVPKDVAGRFIGMGGANIRHITQSTDTRIHINEPPDLSSDPDATQEVSIEGTSNAIAKVLERMCSYFQAHAQKDWFVGWIKSTGIPQTSPRKPIAANDHTALQAKPSRLIPTSDNGKRMVNEVMESLSQQVWEDARGFSISCVIPAQLVAPLIGAQGGLIKQIEAQTGTRITFHKKLSSDSYNMNIEGPLASVTSAHMLMMQRYLDAEAHVTAGA